MNIHTTRVLVVDDDAAIRQLITALLERSDLRVIGDASDGCAAVIATVGLEPDVVLMDYQMPLMDGLTATRLIKQLPHPPRVIIFTGEDPAFIRPLATAVGADAVLEKGSSMMRLSQALNEIVCAMPR